MTLSIHAPAAAPRAHRLAAAVILALGTAGATAGDAQNALQLLAGWNAHAPQRAVALRALGLRRAQGGIVAASAYPATSRAVTNCADTGPGSLRAAVAASADHDTVDMSLLGCSPITLTTGAIQVTMDNLTVQGKGQSLLAIQAGYKAAIFEHTGTGTLAVNDVTLRYGLYGAGGCIFSKGSIALTRTSVAHCKVVGYAGYAAGGGVFATKNLTLTSSVLADNEAYDGTFAGRYSAVGAGAAVGGNATVSNSTISGNHATSSKGVFGGGLYVLGSLSVTSSTISGNDATGVLTNDAFGGGLLVAGTVDIVASTIQGNHATVGGGLLTYANPRVTLTNSTVSNNDAAFAGGIGAKAPLHLNNSTVAFNYVGGSEGGAGVFVYGTGSEFESTIIANNSAGQGCTQKCTPASAAADLSSLGTAVTIAGANNLITSAGSGITLPGDTLTADPMLASFLENNGGPTQTLALIAGSPAIDHGNNALFLASDQRGAPFCRKVGSKPDIGAYETQAAGIGCGLIFADGFQGLP